MNTIPLGLGLKTSANITDCTNNYSIGCDENCEDKRKCPVGWKNITYIPPIKSHCDNTGQCWDDPCKKICSCELDVHNGNEQDQKNWENASFLSWRGTSISDTDEAIKDNCGTLQPQQNSTIKNEFKFKCCLGLNNDGTIKDSSTGIIKQPFSRDHMCSPRWNIGDDTCDDVVAPFCSIPKNFNKIECQLYCNTGNGKSRNQQSGTWCHDATKKFCMTDDNMLKSPLCMNMYFEKDTETVPNQSHPEWLDDFMVNYCQKKQNEEGLGTYPPDCTCILSDKVGKLLFDPVCADNSPSYKTNEMVNERVNNIHKICGDVAKYCNDNNINFPKDFDAICPQTISEKNYFYGCTSSGDCILKDSGKFINDPTCENTCPLHSLSQGDMSQCKGVSKYSQISSVSRTNGNKMKYTVIIIIIVLIFLLMYRLRRKQ
jgi:hypothetical protein